MYKMRKAVIVLATSVVILMAWSMVARSAHTSPHATSSVNDQNISNYAQDMLKQGKDIFRFDTFGDEAFWGDTLHLHQAIAGAANGGVGPGGSPAKAPALGLKGEVN